MLNLNKEEEEKKKKMKNSARALYIGIAKVLPIIDVLGYDGQNSSFSSPLPYSDSTPITQKRKPYINMKLCGYVGFCNAKGLVILTYL